MDGAQLLLGRVVLVSGVGPDLGRSLALRSARAGADVVLAARDEARLKTVADEVNSLGRHAHCVPTDVTDGSSLQNLVDSSLEKFGRVDALLHNAFAQPSRRSLAEIDLDSIRRGTDINVTAALDLTQRLVPALRSSQGAVVMTNSMVIRNRLPHYGAYRMMKSSLLACARSLSVDLGPMGIRVNSIAPGYIWADKMRAYFEYLAESRGVPAEQIYAEVAEETDLRRLPEPDEIADTAVFLISDMARAVAGQCLDVTCGQTHH